MRGALLTVNAGVGLYMSTLNVQSLPRCLFCIPDILHPYRSSLWAASASSCLPTSTISPVAPYPSDALAQHKAALRVAKTERVHTEQCLVLVHVGRAHRLRLLACQSTVPVPRPFSFRLPCSNHTPSSQCRFPVPSSSFLLTSLAYVSDETEAARIIKARSPVIQQLGFSHSVSGALCP